MGSVIPLKKSASSAYLELKVLLNDKLVNYTVQFDYAFDGINSVR